VKESTSNVCFDTMLICKKIFVERCVNNGALDSCFIALKYSLEMNRFEILVHFSVNSNRRDHGSKRSLSLKRSEVACDKNVSRMLAVTEAVLIKSLGRSVCRRVRIIE